MFVLTHNVYIILQDVTFDLFSFPNCSPSKQEVNSVSLFSCSNHSLLSFSSSPLRLVEQPASSLDSNRNELDAPSVINQSKSENRFVQNDEQAISFHSTPCYANRTSRRLHRMCTPAGVSPLLSDSRGPSPHKEPEISALGTPVLFSQMSLTSMQFVSYIINLIQLFGEHKMKTRS